MNLVAPDHLQIARSWTRSRSQWSVEPRFDPGRRWYRRLAAMDDHEVWLLTWLPGQGTDLHDHGGSSGAFTVVSGELTEFTPAELGSNGAPLRERLWRSGQGHRFGARYVHQVVNRGAEPAISVHAYGPALTTMRRYEITETGLRLAAVDLAGAQW